MVESATTGRQDISDAPHSSRSNRHRTVLSLRNITKQFGSFAANDDISLELREGEVLALLGENGAGKTTLMNILFGHYVADRGSIDVFGKPLSTGSPHAAISAGIGMVHQHFTLAENLSVLDNVVLGTKPLWAPFLNRTKAQAKLVDVSTRSGLVVDPDRLVKDLTVGEQQRVEILKALYRGARILILDEPTAVLTPQETDQLFATIRELVDQGMSVIFISHKLKEVMTISDRVVVLRRGRAVFDSKTVQTSRGELAQKMIGRELPAPKHIRLEPGEAVLQFDAVDVMREDRVKLLDNANLALARHEILGVVGVSGNGQQAMFQVVSGLTRPNKGQVMILGKAANSATPNELVERGVARIPEDRQSMALIVDMSVWENLISERYRSTEFQKQGFLRRKDAFAHTETIMAEFDIRCPSPATQTRLLSGGNMQKLILGRTLHSEPSLIIANQPTRGLDVGAVSFVHERLIEAKERGAGILLISEDLDELLELSDRLVVIYRGRISRSINRADASVEELGLMMMGHEAEAAT